MKETIYVAQSTEFETKDKYKICKLKKALYDLK